MSQLFTMFLRVMHAVNKFLKRFVRRPGNWKVLFFRNRTVVELDLGGDSSASLWSSSETMSLKSLHAQDKDFHLLYRETMEQRLWKIIRIARFWMRSMSFDRYYGKLLWNNWHAYYKTDLIQLKYSR